MNFPTEGDFRWSRVLFWGILLFAVQLTFANHTSEGGHSEEEFRYQCEKYCHMDCRDIPDNHPNHREQCEYVHSHKSECHCHLGGSIIGVFVAIGLSILLIVLCCVCRFCRKRSSDRDPTTTNTIVVVTQPETVTTITHQDGGDLNAHNHFRKHPPQKIYAIETVAHSDFNDNYASYNIPHSPTMTSYAPGVTVITNSTAKVFPSDPPKYQNPSPPSERVYFDKVENSNEEPEDPIFLPPKYS